MSLPSFSVKNQVLVNMLMVVILVAGAAFAFTLVREMFPESRPNKLGIVALYPGVQPEEIEKAVTIKIEEAIRDVDGVEKVESTVTEGVSSTIVTLFNEVKNVDATLQYVKNEIDAIEDLPDEVEQLRILKLEPKLPVIMVALYGEDDEAGLKRAARRLRDDLLLLPGVSEVEISGTRDDEISVEIQPDRLLEYDVTFDEVAEAIRTTNLDVSGGNLKGDRTTVSVRTLGEKQRGVDLESIPVRSLPDGRKILLRDVARIHDGFVDTDAETYVNGERGVNLVIYKTPAQDAIQISTLVKSYVKGKQGVEFSPYGFSQAYDKPWYIKPFALARSGAAYAIDRLAGRPDPLAIYNDSRATGFDHNYRVLLHTDLARFVEGRLDLMLRNGFSGLILVIVTLNLFLNWRVAFWAAVGLPVAFLGTFVVMWALGATINLLSMFGLIIVLGIIVDDAIVIGENIFRHIEEGMPPVRAAVVAAEEVMWPVIIAVTTTIAAFAPLFFIKGQIGDFMGQLPIVVMAALTVSLIEALVILPAHLSHLPSRADQLKKAKQPSRIPGLRQARNAVHGVQTRVMHTLLPDLYERFLRFTLRWRYVTLAVSLSLLALSCGLVAGGVVERVFIQKMDAESLICALEMPVGTTADNVRQRLQTISRFAVAAPEVESVQMHVARQYDVGGAGSTGVTDQSHLGQLIIELKAADVRERLGLRSSEDVMTEFRTESAALPGVNSVTWESLSGGPGGKDIHILISGGRFDEIVKVGEKLKQKLGGFAGVFDLDDDFDKGKREVQLRLRESARPTGITVGALGAHIRSATYGREARRITRNREDVKIMVRYPEEFRTNIYNIENMWIPTAGLPGARGWVPLHDAAELTETESFTTIHRNQQERSVTVYGSVDENVASSTEILGQIRQAFDAEISTEHPGVRIEFLGSFEEQMKAFSGLKLAFPVAILLIYMMLAGLFRSYFQPIVVISAIPFGLMGAIVGHWMTGNPMTVLSNIGMVALTGIVVNDSLVLVDFINSRVRRGQSHFEASVQGARLRLRAILLTTLTTVAGLTPLMFETSFQAKFLIPMAVTLTFGLMFATGLTLIIVPALNMIFFDLACLLGRSQHEADEDGGLPPAPLMESEEIELAKGGVG